jgi:sigma-B regulation protein RsbU (phosphoserine phosphatase)
MSTLAELGSAYREATRCEVAVWGDRGAEPPAVLAATPGSPAPRPPGELPARGAPPRRLASPDAVVAPIDGPRMAWLVLGPCATPGVVLEEHLRFLLPATEQYLQSALEVEHAANELAERYEEINLLYTISEILGRTLSLDEAAATILEELADTVGARRASIHLHEPASRTLRVIAAIGGSMRDGPPISVDDETSVSARVFRSLHPTIVDADEPIAPPERPYRCGGMLSVPILWTAGRSGEPLGVVNLSDRRTGQPFTAGDLKLVAAIATQIGTAIQNARLVRASIEQQRLEREMQLAHDLQMRLLPHPEALAPTATIAARVVPAESVGGDFYHLFRLADQRAGILIGDVSGHGYQAALIMALTMSAAAIHAQRTGDPGETLRSLLESLQDELETTEMFMTIFYGILDRERHELVYANAGHPHAFVVRAGGEVTRLPAANPPLGMVPIEAASERVPFDPARDLLLLFTDGVSDARDARGERLGEEPVLAEVVEHRAEAPALILERLFSRLTLHTQGAERRDDLTVVLARG